MKKLLLVLVMSFASGSFAFAQVDPNDPLYLQVKAQGYIVNSTIVVAEGDENSIDIAYQQFLPWWSMAVAYPLLAGDVLVAETGLAQAVNHAILMESITCTTNKDPVQIAKMTKWLHWLQDKPMIQQFFGPYLQSANDKIQKCAHFDLFFDSTITASGNGGSITISVKGLYPLTTINAMEKITLMGSGQIKYDKIDWPAISGCSVNTSGDPVMMSVTSASIDIDSVSNTLGNIQMAVSIPTMTEHITYHCPSGSPSFAQTTWWGSWRAFHLHDASHTDSTAFNILDWTVHYGEEFATREYTNAMGAIKEETTLTLVHTPQ